MLEHTRIAAGILAVLALLGILAVLLLAPMRTIDPPRAPEDLDRPSVSVDR